MSEEYLLERLLIAEKAVERLALLVGADSSLSNSRAKNFISEWKAIRKKLDEKYGIGD